MTESTWDTVRDAPMTLTEPTTEAGRALPRCKDSRNPNWTTMGGYCLTHQQPLDACREEMAEAVAAERERIRAALVHEVAEMARLTGGCEKGHRAGHWHIHEEANVALARRLAAIAREP